MNTQGKGKVPKIVTVLLFSDETVFLQVRKVVRDHAKRHSGRTPDLPHMIPCILPDNVVDFSP